MDEARFRYSQALYDREFEIKERLEKKAAAVFALPSVLIGGLFLKAEPIKQLSTALNGASSGYLFASMLLVFVLFLICMLLAVSLSILSITVKQYRKEYPDSLYAFLYNPDSRHLQSEHAFCEEIGGRLAIATEHNAKINENKSKRLNYSVLALLFAVINLLIFLSIALLTGS